MRNTVLPLMRKMLWAIKVRTRSPQAASKSSRGLSPPRILLAKLGMTEMATIKLSTTEQETAMGDVAEELAGLVLDEDDGQENGHRGQGAGEERPPDLRGPVQGRADAGFAHLLVAEKCFRVRRWRCR